MSKKFWLWYIGLLKPRKLPALNKADKYWLTVLAGAFLLLLAVVVPLLVSPWCAFGLLIPATVFAYAHWSFYVKDSRADELRELIARCKQETEKLKEGE